MDDGFVVHQSDISNGVETLSNKPNDLGLNIVALTPSDLEKQGNTERVVEEARAKLGGLNGLVLNHAYSTCSEVGQWSPDNIDPSLFVNVRVFMMIQFFVNQLDAERDSAIALFASGQCLSPMVKEIDYCVPKEIIICLCCQISYLCGDKNIRVNCINQDPNDTGYCSGDVYESLQIVYIKIKLIMFLYG